VPRVVATIAYDFRRLGFIVGVIESGIRAPATTVTILDRDIRTEERE